MVMVNMVKESMSEWCRTCVNRDGTEPATLKLCEECRPTNFDHTGC